MLISNYEVLKFLIADSENSVVVKLQINFVYRPNISNHIWNHQQEKTKQEVRLRYFALLTESHRLTVHLIQLQ